MMMMMMMMRECSTKYKNCCSFYLLKSTTKTMRIMIKWISIGFSYVLSSSCVRNAIICTKKSWKLTKSPHKYLLTFKPQKPPSCECWIRSQNKLQIKSFLRLVFGMNNQQQQRYFITCVIFLWMTSLQLH